MEFDYFDGADYGEDNGVGFVIIKLPILIPIFICYHSHNTC